MYFRRSIVFNYQQQTLIANHKVSAAITHAVPNEILALARMRLPVNLGQQTLCQRLSFCKRLFFDRTA